MGKSKKYKTEEERKIAQKLAGKRYYENNKDKVKKRSKNWIKNNPEKTKDYQLIYYENNKEILLKKVKERSVNTKEEKKKYDEEYYKMNKKTILKKNKIYVKNNRDNINKTKNIWKKNRRLENPLYKLKDNLSSLTYQAFKSNGYIKDSKTEQILGCSYEELKNYIESKFEPWMTWGNYGLPKDNIYELNKTWDIDHKTPLSSAKSEEELIKLCHYINLQPLCSYTNRNLKKNKLNWVNN